MFFHIYVLFKVILLSHLMRCSFKDVSLGVPVVAQWLMNPTRNHEVAGSVPALAQWVNDPALRELWCRLQTRLGSRVAEALA